MTNTATGSVAGCAKSSEASRRARCASSHGPAMVQSMADGNSSLKDIEQRLAALLGHERDGATENVRDLLEKAHKLAAYQSAAPTEDLQAMIGQQLDEVAT